MSSNQRHWVRIAFINLVIVAGLGTIMRYKIGFEFPFFNQKFLQEAHSHFAFSGWITHCLFFLIASLFRSNLAVFKERIYSFLIILNLVCAYGMLISFSVQGYGPVSITLSAFSVVIAYVFSYFAYKDAHRLPAHHPAKNWIKAAILLGILSTLGTIILSHMMLTRNYDQTTYLGSVYFYLHFQYNGWFLFACVALFLNRIKDQLIDSILARKSFWLLFVSATPAYFLSTLWAGIPMWLYLFVVVAAFLQTLGWWYMIRFIRSNFEIIKLTFSKPTRILFVVVALALTLKITLQLGSTIPEISKLAFGFRPIVIAYLHLILLLIVSLFILAYMYSANIIIPSKTSRVAIYVFTLGAILNEIVLSIQGIGAFSYTIIPFANEMLFGIACILLCGAALLWWAQIRFLKH